MKLKSFHITEIISVITGNMVSMMRMDGISSLLEYMCGGEVYTHQLPRVFEECAPYLLKQFPQLAGEKAEGITEETLAAWGKCMEEKYGTMLAVQPLPPGAHRSIDPVAEAKEMGLAVAVHHHAKRKA